jgi:hypothetical protein
LTSKEKSVLEKVVWDVYMRRGTIARIPATTARLPEKKDDWEAEAPV